MNVLKTVLFVGIITLIKLVTPTDGNANELDDATVVSETENDNLFQNLFANISPTEFQQINAEDGEMSFKNG